MALSTTKKPGMGTGKKLVILVLLAGAIAAGLWLQRELSLPPQPSIAISADKDGVGRKTIFTVVVTAPEGVWSAEAVLDGSGLKAPVTQVMRIGEPPADGAPLPTELKLEVPVGKDVQAELVPGKVKLTVTARARPTRLRTPDAVTSDKELDVKLDPPSIASTSQFVHPTQGGAEAVVYEVSASSVRDGVEVGAWFFPGAPLPGATSPTQKFVLFAVPYDMDMTEDEAKAKIKLVAEDALGNRAEARLVNKFFPKPMGRDVIALKTSFMEKVTGEIYARTPELSKPATLLEQYLKLNGELRRANSQELKDLAAKSQPKFLWKQTFLPMQNAAVKGSFADRRSYTFEEKEVDKQDHLGFDLASVERAPIQAANDGVVVVARYMGIFGNCVILDHGFGLMSLYAHLSTISVKAGDSVTRGQEVGRTGATGLAGGDHLHFTMLLWGLPVTPVEWWDGHWIKDRLQLKLGAALPWAE